MKSPLLKSSTSFQYSQTVKYFCVQFLTGDDGSAVNTLSANNLQTVVYLSMDAL